MNPLFLRELVVFEPKFLNDHPTNDKTLWHTLGTPQMLDHDERTKQFEEELTSLRFLASNLSKVGSGSSYHDMMKFK